MLPHYMFFHFLRMLFYVISQYWVIAKSIFKTLPDKCINLFLQCIFNTSFYYNSPERNWIFCLLFPVFAQVNYFLQTLLHIRKTVFMNDNTQVCFVIDNSIFNTRKDHKFFMLCLRIR